MVTVFSIYPNYTVVVLKIILNCISSQQIQNSEGKMLQIGQIQFTNKQAIIDHTRRLLNKMQYRPTLQ